MGRGTSWNANQDIALVRAWIEVSEDVLVGVHQTAAKFWERVSAAYEIFSKGDLSRQDRSLSCRWKIINAACCKFSGAYDRAIQTASSGTNEDDVIKNARAFYEVNPPRGCSKTFKLMHCWKLLKDCPKFKTMATGGKAKADAGDTSCRVQGSNSSSPSDTDNGESSPPVCLRSPFEGEVRPIGHKKAKMNVLGPQMMNTLAGKLKTSNKIQSECQSFFELTCGALLFSLCPEQIPVESQQFFVLAKKKVMTKLAGAPAGAEAPIPPVAADVEDLNFEGHEANNCRTASNNNFGEFEDDIHTAGPEPSSHGLGNFTMDFGLYASKNGPLLNLAMGRGLL